MASFSSTVSREPSPRQAVSPITIIGILGSLANISQYWQVYKETYQIGASKEEIGNYSVELKKNNTLIHVIGGLALGRPKLPSQGQF